MATLTIADLDNGKRDLQTVSEVANSRAATSTTRFGQQTTTLYEAIRRIRADGDEQLQEQVEAARAVIRSLGFSVPVLYTTGLEVTQPNFTVVGPDGNIYAAQPNSVPFVTGAWDASQWFPIQNTLDDHKLLTFDTLVEAEAAAATLPDGQNIRVSEDGFEYVVTSGSIQFSKVAQSLLDVRNYGGAPDPVSDSTAAFLEAASVGGPVFVPAGEYKVTADVEGTFYSFGPVSVVGGGSVNISYLASSHDKLSYFSAKMAGGSEIKIACYGDSTTDGFATTGWTANPTSGGNSVGNSNHNLTSPNAWPTKLEPLLREMFANPSISVFNAGYSGKSMADGWAVSNYDRAITLNPFYGTPHLVLVAFGLNDVRPAGSQVEAFIRESRKLALLALARGTVPVFVTSDPILRNYAATNAILNREVTRQIDQAKRAIAAELGVPVIDLASDVLNWVENNSDGYRWYVEQADGAEDIGLHFRDNGHSIKAQAVAKTLFTDTVVFTGAGPKRIMAADARTNAFGNYLLTLNGANDTHTAQGFSFRVNYYDTNPDHRPSGPNAPMMTMWVWNEDPEAELIYRGVGYEGWGIVNPDHPPAPVGTTKAPSVTITPATTGVVSRRVPAMVAFETNSYYRMSDLPYRVGRLPLGLSKVQYLCGDLSHYTYGSKAIFYYGYFELWKTQRFTNSGFNVIGRTGELSRIFPSAQELVLVPEMSDGGNVFGIMDANPAYPENAVVFEVDATLAIGAGVVLAHSRTYGGTSAGTDGVGSVVATVLQRTGSNAVRLYLVKRAISGEFISFARTLASAAVTVSADRLAVSVRIARDSANDTQTVEIRDLANNTSVHSSSIPVTAAAMHLAGAVGGLYWAGGGAGSARVHKLSAHRR